MAALSKSNYESSLRVNEFKGFYQGTEGVNTNIGYAADGKNFDVTGGVLHSMGAGSQLIAGNLAHPIETLMMLNRRFVQDSWAFPNANSILIAATEDGLFARVYRDTPTLGGEWTRIKQSIQNPAYDYVAYEVNSYWVAGGVRVDPKTAGAVEVTADAPIDVLLITNSDDGMYIIYGDNLDVVPFRVQPSTATSEKKFGVLTRHADRIWGGAITGDPDMLMYSASFNPLDWNQNDEYPEDGAGDIQQPSWDGDSFVALRTYGSYLLAIKRNRIWRVSGTNPGEYYWKEQFGGGTIVENTVVVNSDYMYLLSYDGLMMYDGTSVQRYRQPTVRGIMDRVNWQYAGKACAAMRGPVYCLALPLDGSTINNAVLEYNTSERTFQLREGVYVASFLQHEDKLIYTDAREPESGQDSGTFGRVLLLDDGGETLPFKYVTAYQDIGYKSITKSGFELYITADQPIVITASVRTEKKFKQRTVQLVPWKTKRIRLNASGRMFRLELSVPSADTPWKILGTLELNFEIDWD